MPVNEPPSKQPLDDQELSALIREHGSRHAAPAALRAGIRTQVALADANRPDADAPMRSALRGWRLSGRALSGKRLFAWVALPVSFALGMLCMALLAPTMDHFGPDRPLDAQLVADHVRALRVGPLAQVLSSDRHTVKPWFQGRIDYAPPVYDFATEGFPLIGGRIEHVRGNAVATLVYGRNQHKLDLFVWPSSERTVPLQTVHNGFNIAHWADGAMQFWVVADMDRSELESFVQLWQARAAAQ